MSAAGAARALFWFRRDLRLSDNRGLARCLAEAGTVAPVFVFDTAILDALPRADRRVDFLHRCVSALHAELAALGGGLHVLHGEASTAIPALAARLGVDAVYANHDAEPEALARDAAVARSLAKDGRSLRLERDTAWLPAPELLTGRGTPYTVFTPYRNAWMKRVLAEPAHAPRDVREALRARLAPSPAGGAPSLADLGFVPADPGLEGGEAAAAARLRRFAQTGLAHYASRRDELGTPATSGLSVDNRFGCVSIRTLVATAVAAAREPSHAAGAQAWLSELCWRDFFFQILEHFPHVAGRAFRPVYDDIEWPGEDAHFAAWCEGRTGYPIVDAAMTELAATGRMHNRLRMVCASFLVKDLLIDWRRGEAWFARHLLDYDLAANNGNWQWAASTGCDAQPYFRVFNPARQSARFDARAEYIRKQLPALRRAQPGWLHEPWRREREMADAGIVLGRDYPWPIVEHAVQARRAVRMFELAKADLAPSGVPPDGV